MGKRFFRKFVFMQHNLWLTKAQNLFLTKFKHSLMNSIVFELTLPSESHAMEIGFYKKTKKRVLTNF